MGQTEGEQMKINKHQFAIVAIATVLLLGVSTSGIFAAKSKVILAPAGTFSNPADGELAFDASVNGPSLFHHGAWRSFAPIANAKFPDMEILWNEVKFTPDSHALLLNGDVCRLPASVAFAGLANSAVSHIQVGVWNALFAIPGLDGLCEVVSSTSFTQPSAITGPILSDKKYRYLGGFYSVGDPAVNAAAPMTRVGNHYHYLRLEDLSGDPPPTEMFPGGPLMTRHEFINTAPLTTFLTVSAATTNPFSGLPQILESADLPLMLISEPAPPPPAPPPPSHYGFTFSYSGTPSYVRVMGHSEDPTLFRN